MSLSQNYWDQNYTTAPFKTGKAPTKFLESMIPRLKKGKTLDIGMGEGANAVYLALKGFTVKGFDVSSVAVEHANTLANESGVEINATKTDLDLFLFGLLEYETIIMTYFRPPIPRYYSEIIRALKQGGTLLIESFLVEERKDVISKDESFKDFYYKTNEILHNLRGMRILFYQEGLVNNKHTVQCLAQKPLDKDVAKYDLFNMQTSGKEKAIDSQRELAESLFKKKS